MFSGLNVHHHRFKDVFSDMGCFRGFMYIGTNNWREAYGQFQAVLDLEPHNIIVSSLRTICSGLFVIVIFVLLSCYI